MTSSSVKTATGLGRITQSVLVPAGYDFRARPGRSRAGMIRRARSRHRAGIFGKLDRASGLRRNLSVDRPRTQAYPGPPHPTVPWPDRANKAIQEVRRPFHDAPAEGMASRRRSCAPN